MASYRPHYRLTVYAPRSIDPAETTILVPVVGAAHSDQFKVTTMASLAGWKPYLYHPQGRTGKIDVLTRATDIGVINVTLMDPRLSNTDNLTRWMTAFFGSLKQEFRAGGLKAKLEESTDNGVTWASWFTGRLQTVRLSNKLSYVLQIQDEASELKQYCFVGRPHSSITYAGVMALAPVGLTAPYGTIPAVTPFTGVASAQIIGSYVMAHAMGIQLDASQAARPDMIVTAPLVAAVAPGTPLIAGGSGFAGGSSLMPNFSGPARAHLTHTSGANNGLTGDYYVGGLGFSPQDKNGHVRLMGLAIGALPTTEANYLALPAAGVTVKGYIISEQMVDQDHPLLIDVASAPILIADLLAGKFGYVWHAPESLPPGKAFGDLKRAYVTNFASFVSDTTYPPVRLIITQPDELGKTIQDQLLKSNSLAMFFDADAKVNLVDLRLPSSLAGIPIVSDADLVNDQAAIDWTFDRSQAISRVDGTRYTDRVVATDDLNRSPDRFPTPPAGLLVSIDHPLILLALGSGDFGDQTYQMDAPGYRSIEGETYQGQGRGAYLENKLLEHMQSLRRPFAVGASTATLKCRRTANVPRVPGGLLLLGDPNDATKRIRALPDPATNKRGGARLVRVTSVFFNGPEIDLICLDMGIATVAAVPSAAQPAQEGSNTSVGVTSVITLNGVSQPVELRYAVTDTSVGTVPVDTDPAWTMAPAGINPILAAGTVTFRPSTPGKRIWVQVRTMPTSGQAPQLPSAWVLAGGTGRVDLAAWPTPSALTKLSDTGRAVVLGWTNGATDLQVQALIRTPITDPGTVVQTLPPGSSQYQFVGTDPATAYRLGVRYYDGRNVGPETTLDITTNASSLTAPAMAGASVLV